MSVASGIEIVSCQYTLSSRRWNFLLRRTGIRPNIEGTYGAANYEKKLLYLPL